MKRIDFAFLVNSLLGPSLSERCKNTLVHSVVIKYQIDASANFNRKYIIIIRGQIWNRHWRPCLSKHLYHQTTSKNLNRKLGYFLNGAQEKIKSESTE